MRLLRCPFAMLRASAHRNDRMGRDESDSGEGLPQSDARRRVQGFSLQQASLAMTGTRLGAASPSRRSASHKAI